MKEVKDTKARLKGQLTIIGLLTVFIMLIIFSALLPSFNSVISSVSGNLTDPASQTLVQLIPLIIVVVIIMGIFMYGQVRREEGGY